MATGTKDQNLRKQEADKASAGLIHRPKSALRPEESQSTPGTAVSVFEKKEHLVRLEEGAPLEQDRPIFRRSLFPEALREDLRAVEIFRGEKG